MPILELILLLTTVSGFFVGALSVCWARTHSRHPRGLWGRRLFVGNLLALGAIGLLAALYQADGLAPLGLVAGILIIAMLWEGPLAGRNPGRRRPPRPDSSSGDSHFGDRGTAAA